MKGFENRKDLIDVGQTAFMNNGDIYINAIPSVRMETLVACHVSHSHSVYQGCDLAKVKNPEKWVAGSSLPLVLQTKPPEPPGCLIIEDLQTLHIPKQETRGLDAIQATSLFPWWLTSLLSRNF